MVRAISFIVYAEPTPCPSDETHPLLSSANEDIEPVSGDLKSRLAVRISNVSKVGFL